MALLAYEEPEKSPMFYLLSVQYRQRVAESLNQAILGLFHFPFHDLLREFLLCDTDLKSDLHILCAQFLIPVVLVDISACELAEPYSIGKVNKASDCS